jgi:HEAT repeat protein
MLQLPRFMLAPVLAIGLAGASLAIPLSLGAGLLPSIARAADGSGGTGGALPGGMPGGGGGYGKKPPGAGTPASPGPNTPGPATGPSGPKTPGMPGPATPPPKMPGSPKTPGPGLGSEDDTCQWKYWWYYNSKPYLNLRSSLYVPPGATGSGDFYLGRGTSSKLRPEDLRTEMVAALLELLARGESKEIVDAAMISLAKLGEDPLAQNGSDIRGALERQLGNSSQLVAETAAISLGILGRDESAFALAHILADDEQARALRKVSSVDNRTRAYAAYALGLIGARTSREEVRRYVVSRLCAEFELGGEAALEVPTACLLAMGIVALPSDPAWAAGKERLVPSQCREAQIEWSLRVFADPSQSSWVRAHAPTTVARLLRGLPRDAGARARAIEIFLARLRPQSSAEREVQQSCVLALGPLAFADNREPDLSVRKALMGITHAVSDQQTRMFALVALGQIGARPGEDAGAALDDIRTYLLRELLEGRRAARPWAAIGIAVLERGLDDAAVQLAPSSPDMKLALRQALATERQPELMGALCTAIGIVRDRQGAPEILAALDSTQDTEARGHALVALGLIGARESLDKIEGLLAQSKYRPEIVQKAATALGLMRDAQLVPQLVGLMDDTASVASLGAVCFALGRVGDVRGVEALLALARNSEKNNIARGLATEALGAVADKDLLPWNTALSSNTNYCAKPSTLSDPQVPGILDMD